MRMGAIMAGTFLVLPMLCAQTPEKKDPRPPTLAQPLLRLDGHSGAPSCVAFSPDGLLLATGGDDKRLAIWDAKTGKQLREFPAHPNEVWAVAFSPDGKRLVSGGRADLSLRWWDPATGSSLGTFEGHRGGIPRLEFTGDRLLLSAGGSWDPRIFLWDHRTGKELRTFKGHATLVRGIAVSGDGTVLASVSDDGSARLWDMATGGETRLLAALAEELTCLALTRDGRTVAIGGLDGSLRLVESCTGQLRLPKLEHDESFRALRFAPDCQTLLGGCDDGTIVFVDPARLRPRHSLRAHTRMIRDLALSSDGTRLASAANDTRIWDVAKLLDVKPRPATHPSRHELDLRWEELGSDAIKGYRAVLALIDGKESAIPYLAEHLKPVSPTDSAVIARLIRDLDSDQFRIRDAATKELEQLGDQAALALRQALTRSPTLDLQRRLERLLARLEPVNDPETLRALRALEVLEHIGTAESRRIVERLTKGPAEARVTAEAKRTLGRIGASAAQ
jgi:WD40 repeat protein